MLCRMSSHAPPQGSFQLMVVADNLLTRAGLAALLRERGWTILAQSDWANLVEDIEVVQPDILVIDLGWQADALIGSLEALGDETPVLALVGDDETEETLLSLWLVMSAIPGFAILPRESDLDAIDAALNALDLGLVVLDPGFSAFLSAATPRPYTARDSTLTAREDEVLQLLAQGLTNKAIALKLGITEHTVKFHVNAIMTKLQAQSRTEAVVRATQLGMIVL